MRLGPLPADRWDDAVQHALAPMLPTERRTPDGAGNALATLVHHPDLTRAFLRFNVHLLYRSTLPERLRELAILRVAHRRGCSYEWAHHVTMGKAAGLTDDDIADLQHGAARDPLDAAVLTAVDELDDKSCLSEATEVALTEHLTERQCLDLVFTIGCYTTLAMAFNTFGVDLEQEQEN
ncbi:carboxymuconolactone decarboxylase family protein [Mycobacterium sp. pUA109]|uniref:carboxymuconolactone decarboxylase family protein n=1 Tax=Mycobacterium sp. pUA109 TaxID=3238982 RepID=UPI00351B797C